MGKKDKHKDFSFNAFDLIQFTWDKKWILIAVSTMALIASVIVSLSITPKFRSGVVFFPAASVSLSKSLAETSMISVDSRDILSFGDQTESERMLQILGSSRIRDYIIRKYDLMNHYEIDPASAYPNTILGSKFRSNIKFRRTEFNSIEITVLDTDPQMAADIANDIAGYVDSVYHEIQLERAREAFLIIEHEYLASQEEVSELGDSLNAIRDLGVLDYESQAAVISEAYTNALSQGNMQQAQELRRQLDILTRYGGIYVQLSNRLESEMERMNQLKAMHAAYKINIDQTIPQIYVVDHAEVAERKAVPHRSMIVMVSVISTFAFTLLLLVVLHYFKVLK